MHEQKLHTANIIRLSEKDFYSNYDWCLNPILTLRDIFKNLNEEIERISLLPYNWQREEAKINIYIFVCAVECTIEDFISWRPFDLMPLTKAYKHFKRFIIFFQTIINLPYLFISYPKIISTLRWKIKWTVFVDDVCRLLLSKKEITHVEFLSLKSKYKETGRKKLPQEVLSRRMKLNEGFRCQDLTHYDIITLVDKFLNLSPGKTDQYAVVGARTAGSYFAPLVKTYLEMKGFNNVSRFSVRPKKGLSWLEKGQLKRLLSKKTNVILTDDYSNTGQSFQLLQKIIWKFGTLQEKTTILAPIHPMKSSVIISKSKKVKILTLDHAELFKNKFLDSYAAAKIVRSYFADDEWDKVSINKNMFVDLNNLDFEIHYADSFQVRLKKLIEISLENQNGIVIKKRIFCKSAGWGWLGYHAYLAGTKLSEYVPGIIGLRHGLLFMDWIEGNHLDLQTLTSKNIESISSYTAARKQKLFLNEDPRFNKIDTGWGWQEIISMLRRAYGVRTGYLKNNLLRKQLGKSISVTPTLVDGRMNIDEWIVTNNKMVKTDFEQHNFGAPEFDIVDTAYDLAAASFEFHISEEEEKKLFEGYVNESEDKSFYDRIILYKLFYATIARRKAHLEILENILPKKPVELNLRYLYGRNFLINTMNRFCSSFLTSKNNPVFNRKHFFMDLDGVFDTEIFGFPHTTLSGLKSISLLAKENYSVILNTGRSIEHVRNYCACYNFNGGIAEYGSVLWDNLNIFEVPLIGREVISQLEECREILKNINDVFIDPDYKYSVRAYRFDLRRTKGLKYEEASDIIRKFKFDKLKIICRGEDTYFVGKDTSKGNAVHDFKNYLRLSGSSVAAIGDSDEDISMLKAVERSFAPANCSKKLRESASQNNIFITSKYRQRGLLEAVLELIGKDKNVAMNHSINAREINTVEGLVYHLLGRAEQPTLEKIFVLLNWKKL